MSKEAFNTGSGDGNGKNRLGYNPVGVPSSDTDASGIMLPAASRPEPEQNPEAPIRMARARAEVTPANPVYGMIREAEKFRAKPGASNAPKVVKLQDAITIANGLGHQLMVLHQDLHKSGILHQGIAAARTHLFGDATLPDTHPNRQGALQLLAQARTFAPAPGTEKEKIYDKRGKELTSTDGLAWDALGRAGKKIMAAHKALAAVSPEKAADVSFSHSIEGNLFDFTPTRGFDQITRSNTQFREQGKKPNTINIRGKKVPRPAVTSAIVQDEEVQDSGMSGVDILRPEVTRAARKALRGTRRARKIEGISAKTSMFNVDAPTAPKVEVEPIGTESSNKPKKSFRAEAPTEEKALTRVEKQGK